MSSHDASPPEPPTPTLAEELQGLYGDRWHIYRELLEGGKHGDWIADPLPTAGNTHSRLRAKTIGDLAKELLSVENSDTEESDHE